jgi:sugar lactone lactonase YvrE
MTKKLFKLTQTSIALMLCTQVSAATVSTAFSDFPFRVDDGLSIDVQGNIYASNLGAGNSDFTEFSGTSVTKIAPDGTMSILSEHMQGPLGNAVDSMGNVYVANINDQTIRKVSPDGVTSFFAQLEVYPAGIAIDSDNNLFVASYTNNNITKVTASGEVSLFSEDEKLSGPVGIVFDGEGNLYAANYNNGDIHTFSESGDATFIAHVDGGPDFFNTGYMTYASGNLYATGIGYHKLFKVSLEGEVTTLAGTGIGGLDDGDAETATFACPNGITANPTGDILYWNEYCAGGVNGNGIIRTLRLQAEVSNHAEGFEIMANDGVSIAPDGTVYISNVGNTLNPEYTEFDGTSIIKVAPDGSHSILTDQLTGPLGNAVDSMGNVIVANVNDMSIKSVASDGTVSTLAELDVVPAGIAVDSADNIIIASYNANKIYRLTTNGEMSILSEDPMLSGPVGIVFDEQGILYVANYNNGDIYQVSSTGELTFIAHIDGIEGFTIGYMTYASGYFYASGIGGNEVYRVSKSGEVVSIAGTGEDGVVNGEGDNAKLSCPNGISALTIGNELFVTDYCSPSQLRKISLATSAMKFYSDKQAQADEYELVENSSVTHAVLDNDDLTDLSETALNVKVFVSAHNGNVTVESDNTIRYTPSADFTGMDSYSYTYTDDDGMTTKPVKVKLTVNEAPAVVIPEAKSEKNSGGATGFGSLVILICLSLLQRLRRI